MTRQDGEAVEKALGNTIGLGELKDDGVRVDLTDGDGFAADDQQVALSGVYIYIKIDMKAEEHIVSVEGRAVGEFQALSQLESVLESIAGDCPGFGDGRLSELRRAIDMHEVALHYSDHFAGRRIGGGKRIQRLRLGAKRDDEAAARSSNFSGEYQQIFFGSGLPSRCKFALGEKRE